jgi:glycosyltransferase involved in cell wall biosynthesis
MKIVLFTQPQFLPSQSMSLYARMIDEGMRRRGHKIAIWSPSAFLYRLPVPQRLKKWLGYCDQFILFPLWVLFNLQSTPTDTLFVFTDQALGPWVSLVQKRPHVIHCHDFLALRSALNEFPQNPLSWTGKWYQLWIKRGFVRGKNFISVSEKTRSDLHRYLTSLPLSSAVVYNGLNYPYHPLPGNDARALLTALGVSADQNYLLHVGGNFWYKNRIGVLEIYKAYTMRCAQPFTLLMIGSEPSPELAARAHEITQGHIVFLTNVSNQALQAAYSMAQALIFPSLSEGFGWPVAEAMACGCPVLTTGVAPLTEVGGEAAGYIPVMPVDQSDVTAWAAQAADSLLALLNENDSRKMARREEGFRQVELFDAEKALNAYEQSYLKILAAA